MKNRLEHIREQVKNEKKVTVSELSKIYKVTEETIRRDLEKLEKEGFLTRTFGGAVCKSEGTYPFLQANIDQSKGKG